MKFPVGEGNGVAGGREFGICGARLLFVIGGTVTVGCLLLPLLIFTGGSVCGVAKLGKVFTLCGISEGLYILFGRLPGDRGGGRILGSC